MPVAGEETSEAQNIGMIGAADDHRPPAPVSRRLTRRRIKARMMRSPSSASPPEIAESARRDDECLDCFLGIGIHQGRAT
jgi:hypothetical protein